MIDEKPIKTTVEELTKLLNVNNYIGEPIETEDKILIPFTKAAAGFGIGESAGNHVLTGSGAGVSIEPISMVVVTKGVGGIEGIRTLNLTAGTEMNKALSDIGLIITDIIKEFIPTPQEDPYINVDDMDIQDGEIYEENKVKAEESVNVDINENK